MFLVARFFFAGILVLYREVLRTNENVSYSRVFFLKWSSTVYFSHHLLLYLIIWEIFSMNIRLPSSIPSRTPFFHQLVKQEAEISIGWRFFYSLYCVVMFYSSPSLCNVCWCKENYENKYQTCLVIRLTITVFFFFTFFFFLFNLNLGTLLTIFLWLSSSAYSKFELFMQHLFIGSAYLSVMLIQKCIYYYKYQPMKNLYFLS